MRKLIVLAILMLASLATVTSLMSTVPGLPATVQTDLSPSGERVDWQVVAAGGERGISATHVLMATLGQTVSGRGGGTTVLLNSGFWQDWQTGCCLIPGDADHNGNRDISDLTFYVDYMFAGGPAPLCMEEFDNDGNCTLDISDLTYYVEFMFGGGPEPVDCHSCT